MRRFLSAYRRGDMVTARALMTDDVDFHGLETDGSRVDLRGFEAVVDWVRRRDQELGMPLTHRLLDRLSSEDQVVLVFETDPPPAAGQAPPRMALWSFTGERISSVRIFSAPDAHAG